MAHSLIGLANLYAAQGRYEEAEPFYQRTFAIYEQTLGLKHPETAGAMGDFARLREIQGYSEEAQIWYTRTLTVYEQVFGAHYPETTAIRKRLIALLHTLGQHEEAVQLEAVQPEL